MSRKIYVDVSNVAGWMGTGPVWNDYVDVMRQLQSCYTDATFIPVADYSLYGAFQLFGRSADAGMFANARDNGRATAAEPADLLIQMAQDGTSADEEILMKAAQNSGSVIVSNDKYVDWRDTYKWLNCDHTGPVVLAATHENVEGYQFWGDKGIRCNGPSTSAAIETAKVKKAEEALQKPKVPQMRIDPVARSRWHEIERNGWAEWMSVADARVASDWVQKTATKFGFSISTRRNDAQGVLLFVSDLKIALDIGLEDRGSSGTSVQLRNRAWRSPGSRAISNVILVIVLLSGIVGSVVAELFFLTGAAMLVAAVIFIATVSAGNARLARLGPSGENHKLAQWVMALRTGLP